MKPLSFAAVSARWIFALFLVLGTYNPSGYSYFHWVRQSAGSITPYIAIAGIVLLIGWAIYLKATFNSLGLVGVLLAALMFGCLIWLLVYWKWLNVHNTSAMAWVVEVVLAALLTIGMCWSFFKRAWTGQVDMVETNER